MVASKWIFNDSLSFYLAFHRQCKKYVHRFCSYPPLLYIDWRPYDLGFGLPAGALKQNTIVNPTLTGSAYKRYMAKSAFLECIVGLCN